MMYDNASDFWDGMEDLHEFSFFRKPIQNTEPYRAITVVDVYRYVVGHYAKQQTETLRAMPSSSEAKKFKATHLTTAHSQDCSADGMKKNCCNTQA